MPRSIQESRIDGAKDLQEQRLNHLLVVMDRDVDPGASLPLHDLGSRVDLVVLLRPLVFGPWDEDDDLRLEEHVVGALLLALQFVVHLEAKPMVQDLHSTGVAFDSLDDLGKDLVLYQVPLVAAVRGVVTAWIRGDVYRELDLVVGCHSRDKGTVEDQ